MAFTIAVVNLKGGVGKTTLSTNLACALHAENHRVAILDCDTQQTALDWAAQAALHNVPGPAVFGMHAQALSREMVAMHQNYDAVVIDTPARLGAEARFAMLAANLVLIPIKPSFYDNKAFEKTLAAYAEAMAFRPDLRGAVVMNEVDRTEMSRDCRRAVEECGLPVLDTAIGDRTAFRKVQPLGQGVVTWEPKGDAAREIRSLLRDILRLFQSAEAAE